MAETVRLMHIVDLAEVARLNVIAQRTLLRVIEGRLTAPVVGFPLSGVVGKHLPLRIERERLQVALSGLPAGTWKVTIDCSGDENQRNPWTLTIEATWRSKTGALCKSRTLLRQMLCVTPWELRERMLKWAEAQRTRMVQTAADGAGADGVVVKRNRYEVKARQCEEQIARLERQLTTDRGRDNLRSRLIKPPMVWCGLMSESRRNYYHGDYYRDNQLMWKAEAGSRRKIANIAGKYLTQPWSPRETPNRKLHRPGRSGMGKLWGELYAEMAAAGFPISAYNKFGRVGHLKHGPSELVYLKHLHKYAGLCESNYCKLSAYDDESKPVAERAAEHVKELKEVAVAMRERLGVLSEIENLKQLMVSYKEMAGAAHNRLANVVDASEGDTGAKHDGTDGDGGMDALAVTQDSGREVGAEGEET